MKLKSLSLLVVLTVVVFGNTCVKGTKFYNIKQCKNKDINVSIPLVESVADKELASIKKLKNQRIVPTVKVDIVTPRPKPNELNIKIRDFYNLKGNL